VHANSGGKAPRRSKPKTASGAPKPRVSKPKGRTKTFSSVETWERKSSGSWTSGQSNKLNPGSEQATARRRNTPKYVARTKKVIRPRVRKQADN
jgi:hypothetical protein